MAYPFILLLPLIRIGRLGAPDSWKTAEFNRQWGLEAISAEFAYARGYTGKGVTIGIIDNAILSHSEFAGKLTRLDNGSYNFSYDKQDNMSFGDHGTHVAGIAAAKRDGGGMHGVAFDADIIGTKLNDYGNRNGREELIQSAARVINNSWGLHRTFAVTPKAISSGCRTAGRTTWHS